MAMDQAAATHELARQCQLLGGIIEGFQANLDGQTDSIDRMFRAVQVLAMTVGNLNRSVEILVDALPATARTHRIFPRVPQFDVAPHDEPENEPNDAPEDPQPGASQPEAPQPVAVRTPRRTRPDHTASAAKRQRKD